MFINNFDPVAFQIFSIEIRWYSLAYVMGISLGWYLNKKIFIEKVICKNGYSFNFPVLGYDKENCRKSLKKIDGLKEPIICTIDGETAVYVY